MPTTEDGLARRAGRHLRWRAERAWTAAADRMRRGDRTVIMTPPVGPRLGNLLYLWLAASERSAGGRPTRVLASPSMEPWWPVFPELHTLTVRQADVSFHDRREWDADNYYQRFGVDFSRDGLDDFVRRYLAPAVEPDDSDRLVINIRRGDYYAEEHLRERYGFDQVAFVTEAMTLFAGTSRIVVVSDDADWCRENLGPLLSRHSSDVVFDAPDPVANFLAVAGARRIIGTNSTFTYWGAYVAGAVHSDARVVMPSFHDRVAFGDRTPQADPRWTMLDTGR